MPERLNAASALSLVGQADLGKMARAAHLLDIGQPAFGTGLRPHRTHSGQGTEFLDFRSYRPGEDIRRLDWRVSVRRGRPYVRTYHDELSADWQLCLDRSASMGTPDGSKWTLAVQLAAAFAYMLLHVGNRVGLVQFSNRVDDLCPLGRGRLQYVRIANQLRDSEADSFGGGSVLSATTTVLRPGTHLVILSDFLQPDAMQADLEKLRSPGRKIHAVQILSPSETELSEAETRSVRDVESGEQVSVSSGASHAALAALHRCQSDLKAFSLRNGIRLSSCAATDRWQDVMLRHIAVVTNA
jgi:uncharacterized protein (DUF58 family)